MSFKVNIIYVLSYITIFCAIVLCIMYYHLIFLKYHKYFQCSMSFKVNIIYVLSYITIFCDIVLCIMYYVLM